MKPQEKPFSFRGKYLLAGVMLLYGVLFFLQQDVVVPALLGSSRVLLKIAPVFLLVILFTSCINFFFQPQQIGAYLGRESGLKGWLTALLAGFLSHGPMYAWYPLFEDLQQHGMRDGLIVVFFYARAVKIPLLPLMIDYFGLIFTLALSVYILIASLIQGLLLEKWFIRPERQVEQDGAG